VVSGAQDLRDMIQGSLSGATDVPALFGVRQPDTNILLAAGPG
jgi:hypothetical protein